MVGQRGPASWRKRFRVFVLLVAASNSRRLMSEKSECAITMSPGGVESRRSWWTVEDLARFASFARVAKADKSLKIIELLKYKSN